MAHDQSRQHRADQTRPTIADQLDRATNRIDRLTHRARLGRPSVAAYDEMESEAQAIAALIVATFRGQRPNPTNPPLYVSADGQRAAW